MIRYCWLRFECVFVLAVICVVPFLLIVLFPCLFNVFVVISVACLVALVWFVY